MSDAPDEILDRPLPIDGERVKHVKLRVRRKVPGRRLDKYLHGRFPHLSRTQIQRLIKQEAVLVNDKPTKASYELDAGDLVDMTMPDPEPPEVIAEPIPLDIVYEDDYLLALNKRAGIICHPARGDQTGTLVNGLVYYAKHLSHGSDPFRPGIVHRLDKNTTGVMLVAKDDEAHWRLSLQFERRTVQKTYLAVVEGVIHRDGDTIDAPIGVHPVVREKFAVLIDANKVDVTKPAVTHYEVAERFDGYTLVKLFPKTGRTHQLRVHMSWLKHPIVGDNMYGGRAVSEQSLTGQGTDELFIVNQALHAWKIQFRHPIQQHKMELEAPVPGSFKKLVDLLRAHRSRD